VYAVGTCPAALAPDTNHDAGSSHHPSRDLIEDGRL